MAIAGLAGLICAHLYMRYSVPFLVLPVVGALIGAVLGVVVGIPALRFSGVNLAVVTITASIAVESLVFNSFEEWITGGSSGLILPDVTIFGTDVTALTHPAAYGFVVLVWLSIAAAGVVYLRRSSFGRTLMAVRSNERVAAATGINVARTKTLTFAISSALAGLAGVLLVFMNSTVILSTGWAYGDSVALLVIAVLAGATSVRGGLLAGVLAAAGLLAVWVTDVSWISDNYVLISAIGLILTVIGHPDGISFIRQRWRSARQLPERASHARGASSLTLDEVSVSFGGVKAVSGVSLPIPEG